MERLGFLALLFVNFGDQDAGFGKIRPQTDGVLKSSDGCVHVALVHVEGADVDVLRSVERIPCGIIFRRQHSGFCRGRILGCRSSRIPFRLRHGSWVGRGWVAGLRGFGRRGFPGPQRGRLRLWLTGRRLRCLLRGILRLLKRPSRKPACSDQQHEFERPTQHRPA